MHPKAYFLNWDLAAVTIPFDYRKQAALSARGLPTGRLEYSCYWITWKSEHADYNSATYQLDAIAKGEHASVASAVQVRIRNSGVLNGLPGLHESIHSVY